MQTAGARMQTNTMNLTKEQQADLQVKRATATPLWKVRNHPSLHCITPHVMRRKVDLDIAP